MTGFNAIKHRVIHCLLEGRILHEARNTIDIKNLLATGDITAIEVAEILKKTKGTEHETSPHHLDSCVMVHIVKTRYARRNWYIKWYFLEPDAVFISVH